MTAFRSLELFDGWWAAGRGSKRARTNDRSKRNAGHAEFFALPRFKDLLVCTERIPVMLPYHGFHFIGVVGFDRFENLTVFFLSLW